MASETQVYQRIQTCRESFKEMELAMLNPALLVLAMWEKEVKQKSNQQRDVFGTGKLIEAPCLVFYSLQHKLHQKMQTVLGEFKAILPELQVHVKKWKTHQLHMWTSRRPANFANVDYVEPLCEEVCSALRDLLHLVSSPQFGKVYFLDGLHQTQNHATTVPQPTIMKDAQDVLRKTVQMLLVVSEQPPPVLVIEGKISSAAKKLTGNRTCKKSSASQSKVSGTKKRTTVGILGGRGFGDCLTTTDEKFSVSLVFNTDLANAQASKQKPDHCGVFFYDAEDSVVQQVPYEKTFCGLRLEHFERKKAHGSGLSTVHEMVYFVAYNVSFHFESLMLDVEDQYDAGVAITRSLKVADVIQMLNERTLGIGGRGLKECEKDFLQKKLAIVAGCSLDRNDSIALQDFIIKDKMLLPVYNCMGRKYQMEKQSFSMWRWFHSIINFLEITVKTAWLNGVIYGFASRGQCAEALKDKPNGTFLLRFSESYLKDNHLLSQGRLGAVVMFNGSPEFEKPPSASRLRICGLTCVSRLHCECLLDTNYSIGDLDKQFRPPLPDKVEMICCLERYPGLRKLFSSPSTLFKTSKRPSLRTPDAPCPKHGRLDDESASPSSPSDTAGSSSSARLLHPEEETEMDTISGQDGIITGSADPMLSVTRGPPGSCPEPYPPGANFSVQLDDVMQVIHEDLAEMEKM